MSLLDMTLSTSPNTDFRMTAEAVDINEPGLSAANPLAVRIFTFLAVASVHCQRSHAPNFALVGPKEAISVK